MSRAILYSENIDYIEFLQEKEKEEIKNKLEPNSSYWQERATVLSKIDVAEDWKKVEQKIKVPKSKIKYLFRYSAAAIVIVGLSSLFFIYQSQLIKPPVKITAGTDKAILILENGEKVELTHSTNYIGANASMINNQLEYKNKVQTNQVNTSINTLNIPRGGQFVVQLSDGTKVWLNSESQLKYPVKFNSGEPRMVELLYGEAYFDVTPSSQHSGDSFKVITKNQEIEVLGTEFNVRAYSEEKNIYTSLIEGSVKVKKDRLVKVLSPGFQSVVDSETSSIEVKKVDVTNEAAWKKGLFIFERKPLKEMMDELSRWYDVKIVFVNKEKEKFIFSGSLNREGNIKDLLENLEKTKEVEFDIKDKNIYIK
ncbi:FecR family protein [Tenacibaculum sp. IB213877]|uniref:FecR family protein n=1 Tax=Tenacibaculum sp. IB213877 TaxID=3097351 RepID=UPI002A5A9A41|nr:FecR domain-containing protein [Tenacibaculum sp. IB213877]MDY0779975.1 FecR domain-containing protein [Tenacibaculum sp. IB213877]